MDLRKIAAGALTMLLTVSFAAPAVQAKNATFNPASAYADYISGISGDDGSASQAVTDPSDQTKVKQGSGVVIPATDIDIYSYQTSIGVGDSFSIGVRIEPAESDDYLTYASSDNLVVSVGDDGIVTAVGEGTAVISVTTSQGLRDRFTVYVGGTSEGRTPAIELERTSIDLMTNESYQIKYTLSSSDGVDTVTYRSLNKSVAKVSADGVVTAVGTGDTRIVCTTSSGDYTVLLVYVTDAVDGDRIDEDIENSILIEYDDEGNVVPSRIRFVDGSASVKVGESTKPAIKVYPTGAKYKYRMESSDPTVAEVSKGKVYGVGTGNAIITVYTDNGKSDSIFVTVYDNVIKGIDVSRHNGDVDWKTVKAQGVQFAMIRASFGYEDVDIRVDQNVKGCEKYKIPYGFYHYTYATSVSEAKKEAAFFLNVISEYDPTYPIVLDIEEDKIYHNMSRDEVTAIVRVFMNAFEKAGYYAMIYSYANFFEANVYMDELADYDIWVACWGDQSKLSESYSYQYGIWQYSDCGTMPGITEDVDLNYAYKDYAAIIKKYGLNGSR
ncbi:MAG: Ig-like domain-containing protein [Oscillospiraceae bacterium]|nr:Ig-like domain-containing protein [Oscillospiraceae bacterium]